MADDVVYVNAEEGIKRVMNNSKIYVRLLLKFKDDPTFNSLCEAMTEGNTENARAMSHTLKGLAANLSLIELTRQSLELESRIKNGNLDMEQLTLVKDVYHHTITELDKVITQYA